jgi:Bax protein
LPFIDKENTRLQQLRRKVENIIQQLDANILLSDESKNWLRKLAKKYRVKGNPLTKPQAREDLLKKVDIIPASLTLAQAANESAWGKSRFATEANNLFGIWTYDKSKGLKPKNRDSEKKHLVRIFDHYGESVSYYMHTLNSHPAYTKLRDIRQQQRKNLLSLDGFELAVGLEKYSAKGELYIKLIRDLIRQNQWVQLDGKNLSA